MKKVNVTKKEKSVLQGKLTRLAVQIGKAGREFTCTRYLGFLFKLKKKKKSKEGWAEY